AHDILISNQRWRVFCAIERPAQVCARVIAHNNHLRTEFPNNNASWGRDGKFHITLKFLGEVQLPLVDRLSVAAEHAVAGIRQFDLTLQTTGAFPRKGPPRVLWIGIDDQLGKLAQLQSNLER